MQMALAGNMTCVSLRLMRGLITSIVAALAAVIPAAAVADPVTDAMLLSERFYGEGTRAMGPVNRPRTPLLEAHWSRLAAAMFEAANAADPRYTPLLGLSPAAGPADPEAAVHAAVHGVLLTAFPSRKTELDEALAFNLAQRPAGSARDAGVRLGEEAARLANARVVFAEGTTPWLQQPTSAPGAFVGSNEPMMGSYRWGYRPWLLKDMSAIRHGAFPDLTSEAYARSFDETRRLGSINSKERTAAQTMAARFWVDALNPVPTIRNVALARKLPLVEIARLNALMLLTDMDVIYMVDQNKFGQARWRPSTAIRLAADDNNPATSPDPTWEPYLRNPGSSEFPCGHCTSAAAMAAQFEAELGPYTAEAEFTSDDLPGIVIRGMRWADLGRQASDSRVWGGVHFRYSAEVGEAFGREIAAAARANFVKPIPRRKR